ncbi:MAG TPA: hypothetical protein PKB02_18070 [Anaerohalosphaeraceae bacterium]|nr:hypothetical protein [Anaerohalosphaeraceae bacterium]
MNKNLIACLLLAAVVSVPCLAAETLTISSVNYADYAKIIGIKSDLYTGQAYVGALKLTTEQGNLFGFCIDLYDHSNPGVFEVSTLENAPRSTNNPNGPMTAAKADNIRRLFDVAYYDIVLPELEKTPSAANKDITAAFQLSVWNLIFDNDLSISNKAGSFYTTSSGAFITYANTWMGQLANAELASVGALLNDRYQDYAIAVPVPAPGALLLSSMGMVLVGYLRRGRTM